MGHFPDLGALVGVEGGVSGVFGELCTDAPLEHFLIALLEPGGHVLQFFLLGSESEQGLRYAFFQWNRMDFNCRCWVVRVLVRWLRVSIISFLLPFSSLIASSCCFLRSS